MSDQIRKWKNDASAALLKGKHEKALELYLKVVGQEPNDFSCRSQIGYLLRKLGKNKDAIVVFEKMAIDYADQGFLLKAIANCKIVLELDPQHTHIQQKLADLYAKQSGGASKRSVKVNSHPSTGAQIGGDAVIPLGPDMSQAIELDQGSGGGMDPLELDQPQGTAAPSGFGAPPPTFELLDSQDLGLEPIDMQDSLAGSSSGFLSAGVGVASAATDFSELVSTSASAPSPPSLDLSADPSMESDDLVSASASASTAPAPYLSAELGVDLSGNLSPLRPAEGDRECLAGPTPQVSPLDFGISVDLTEGLSVDLSPEPVSPSAGADAPAAPAAVSKDAGLLSDAAVPLVKSQETPLQEGQELDFALNFLAPEVLPPEEVTLPEIPLFSDLDPDAFVAVLESMKLNRVNPGEWIIKEGDRGDSMFAIASGMVEVIKRVGKSKAVKLATLGEGAFFGEMSVLRGGPRRASIRAIKPSELFEISRSVLDQVCLKYPSVIDVLKRFSMQRLLRNLLFTSPLFQPFTKEERVAIIEKFVSRDVESGEQVIEEGSSANGFYVILQGKMDVMRKLDNGDSILLGKLEEGDVFGEISCLKKSPAVATVQAASPASVLRLSRNEFDELIMSHPQILEMVNDLGEQRWRLTVNTLSQKGIYI